MSRTISFIVAAIALGVQVAYAQPKAPQGAVVVSSEPGKASVVTVAEATATVVAINKTTRVVTLKGAQGRTLDVVCGDEVKNFAQIHVGDDVKVSYKEALTLELKKTRAPLKASASVATVSAAPGSQPAGATGVEVTVLADVVAVDPKKSIISLKGPAGNVIDLKVNNPDQFKVVKKGDQVEAVYSQAFAVAVTPVPKSEGKK
jgi:hypothetical protein